MDENKDKLADLGHFTGGDTWYRHITGALYTDGVQYVAENAGAYWLIDEILFRQKRFKRVRAEEFQVWKLRVINNSAVLTCEDGNDNIVHTKQIEYTDFPQQGITLWFENNTLMLPSER